MDTLQQRAAEGLMAAHAWTASKLDAPPMEEQNDSCSEDAWTITAVQAGESDQESVDVLRFDPPEGRESLVAGEPPPSTLKALNTSAVLAAFGALPVSAQTTPADIAAGVIAQHNLDETFYVFDLGRVARLHQAWSQCLPRITPFYAVKCNPDRAMLAMLAAQGTGFDCASAAEIDLVLGLGVPANRIIYAHPCKPMSHMRHAAQVGVNLTTFDTECELQKVAQAHPGTSLLLRIRADDKQAMHTMGNKYGAEADTTAHLLACARSLGLRVCGVSFHVGSGASNPEAFKDAIALARQVFDQAAALGFSMTVLDLGGGYPGGQWDSQGRFNLAPVAAAINQGLAKFFPVTCGVTVIAEPGRFFAETPGALACSIYGVRTRSAPGAEVQQDYWLSDGLYGSFNCVIYDAAKPVPQPLRNPLLPVHSAAEDSLACSTLFGPTCDGADVVARGLMLPRMRRGDYLLFPQLSAYSLAGACNFNGFDAAGARTFYYFSK